MKTIPNILTPTGVSLLSAAPMSFQEQIAREIVGAATENGGHIIWLGESEADSVSSVSQFTRWAKARGRTNLPHLSAIAYHSVRSVQHLADMLNHEQHGEKPRIVVFDRSRSLPIMVPTDPFPTMLPLLAKLAPANFLVVGHHGVRGVAPTANRAPYTATWLVDEDYPKPPAAREGLRYRITNVADGSTHRLKGRNVPSDLLFDIYEEKVPAL